MSDETTIDELVVTGTGERGAGDGVRAALDGVDWPATSPHEYVFIERLRVTGPLSVLGAATGAAVREAWSGAVRSAARDASVVRFADRAELLAHLAADVAAGRAGARWHWDAWRDVVELPRAEGLARLLEREVAWLASTVARLERLGALDVVWRAQDEAGARRVAVALARRVGADPQIVERGVSAPIADQPDAPSPGRVERARWRRALAGFDASSPHAVLAALVSLVTSSPIRLSEPSAAARIAARAQTLTIDAAHGASPDASVARTPDVAEPARADAARNDTRPDVDGPPTTPADAPDDEPPSFATSFAGFVHVVTALQRAELSDVVAACLVDRPHGWPLVEALARRLGLDDDDPLADWLAAWRDEEEPLPDVAPIERVARALYGDLWDPRLLRADGVVRANDTHVDVELPLSAVRLDLRLAGLDLDPGWVAWLGRVVTIHYVDGGAR